MDIFQLQNPRGFQNQIPKKTKWLSKNFAIRTSEGFWRCTFPAVRKVCTPVDPNNEQLQDIRKATPASLDDAHGHLPLFVIFV